MTRAAVSKPSRELELLAANETLRAQLAACQEARLEALAEHGEVGFMVKEEWQKRLDAESERDRALERAAHAEARVEQFRVFLIGHQRRPSHNSAEDCCLRCMNEVESLLAAERPTVGGEGV